MTALEKAFCRGVVSYPLFDAWCLSVPNGGKEKVKENEKTNWVGIFFSLIGLCFLVEFMRDFNWSQPFWGLLGLVCLIPGFLSIFLHNHRRYLSKFVRDCERLDRSLSAYPGMNDYSLVKEAAERRLGEIALLIFLEEEELRRAISDMEEMRENPNSWKAGEYTVDQAQRRVEIVRNCFKEYHTLFLRFGLAEPKWNKYFREGERMFNEREGKSIQTTEGEVSSGLPKP